MEIPFLASLPLVKGIRCNISLSSEIAASPTADLTNLVAMLDIIFANLREDGTPLMLQLGLGGEGPDKTATAWKALNGTNTWTVAKRPVKGTANAVWDAIIGIQQAAIDCVVDRYREEGFDPLIYVSIETGNEPGLGGSGSTGCGYVGATNGLIWDTLAEGTWDNSTNVPASTTVASFLEFYNYMMTRINTRGCLTLMANFEAQSPTTFAQELATYDSGTDTTWLSKLPNIAKSVNLYYDATNTAGVMGAAEYARLAVYGSNGLGTSTSCFLYKLNQIKTEFGLSDFSSIYVTECGVTPILAGQNGNLDRATNYQSIGKMRLALFDTVLATGVGGVCMFTTTDTAPSATVSNQYGLYDDAGNLYSAAAPLLKRNGKSLSSYPSFTVAAGESQPS